MLNLNTARAARLTRCLKTPIILLAIAMTVLLGLAEQNHKQWSDYGGGPDSSHFIALDQINKSNVSQLQVAWVYPTGDHNAYLFNPIVVDNVMYVLARNSSLVALDATTGKEIWIQLEESDRNDERRLSKRQFKRTLGHRDSQFGSTKWHGSH